MWPKIRMALFRRLSLMESWVIFFVLGLIMMNFPFITIFNKPVVLFDIPLLYLYLQVGWLISIFVIYLFVKANNLSKDDARDEGEHR
jgi:hypothetical protein